MDSNMKDKDWEAIEEEIKQFAELLHSYGVSQRNPLYKELNNLNERINWLSERVETLARQYSYLQYSLWSNAVMQQQYYGCQEPYAYQQPVEPVHTIEQVQEIPIPEVQQEPVQPVVEEIDHSMKETVILRSQISNAEEFRAWLNRGKLDERIVNAMTKIDYIAGAIDAKEGVELLVNGDRLGMVNAGKVTYFDRMSEFLISVYSVLGKNEEIKKAYDTVQTVERQLKNKKRTAPAKSAAY